MRAQAGVDPATARRDAQHILSGRRFQPSSTPRPLKGPLKWLGDHIESALRPVGRVLQRLPVSLWIVALLAVLGVIVWLVVRARRQAAVRARTSDGARGARGANAEEDPRELEREADAAEHDGDLDRAIRLRFRAGLLRLGTRGAIRYRPSVTTGEVRRTLGSPRFDDLAGTFEEVTYGGRVAAKPDVDEARREWPRVLEETGRR